MVSQMLSDGPAPGHFPTTRWSRVVLAGDPDAPRARESLAELCNAYWYPLYTYIRRRGNDPEQARDLTQELFARLLEKGLLAEADPSRGRFRSFLRTVCAHFLANRRDREQAKKRGGGRADLPIDPVDAEGDTRWSWPTG
jgi:RNA polymerase sigma-70 factor (ECF subfamily)